jgi:protein-arginine kinase activator protein McsA
MRCSNCQLEVSSLVPVIRDGEYKPLCIDCFFNNDKISNVIDIVNELLISSRDEVEATPITADEENIQNEENPHFETENENFQPFSEASSKLPDMIKPPIFEKIKKMEAVSRKLSEKDRLLIALSEAIRNEQYESAGLLRDKIQKLNEQQVQEPENQSTES